MRRILTLGAVSVLAVAAAACGDDGSDDGAGGSTAGSSTPESVSIVVSTSVWGDIVASALDGVEGVEVETVMPVGADPHDFAVSARQAEAMEEADLVVVNGLGLEEGMLDVIDAVEESGTTVLAMAEAADLDDEGHEDEGHDDEAHDDEAHEDEGHEDEAQDDEHDDDEHDDDEHDDDEHDDEAHDDEAHDDEAHDEHADGDGHDHGGVDPHVWLDPLLVIEGLEALEVELGALGVEAGPAIDAYIDELHTLDEEIEAQLAPIPGDGRVLVTNHGSLGHFAERYDFEVLGTVIPGLTTAAEPSAADLDELATVIVERDVPAIFTDTSDSDRLAVALADQVGRDVTVVALYTGSLGEPDSEAATYIGMMTTDAHLIAEALT